MQESNFTKDAPGRLVRDLDGQFAFVPDPLPATLAWDNELGVVLSAAERALGRLAGIGQTLPAPRIALRSFLLRAAEFSSRIEGTFASFRDILRALQSARVSSLLLKLVDELFVTPAITVNRAAGVLGVGYTSAQKNVEKLVNARILRKVSGAARNRVYLADGVVEAVEGLAPNAKGVNLRRSPRDAQ